MYPFLEKHFRTLEGLEEKQTKIILKKYRIALTQLRARLLTTNDNTFTESRLKATMVQVEAMIRQLEYDSKDELKQSMSFMHDLGVEHTVSEINSLERKFSGAYVPIHVDAVLASVKKENILLNKFATFFSAYNSSMRAKIQDVLTNGLIQSKGYSEMVRDIVNVGVASEWKAQRIARTELHGIYNIAKLKGCEEIKKKYIPDLKKRLIHRVDARTGQDSIELAKNNPIIDIDRPFIQHYNNKKYTFMAPPNRPNDRAIMIPFRDSYVKQEN
ncbi:MAG: hypothetical protein KAG18_03145 [Sinobacterium sp.]|nr:hypothetical protein [Sinobacterium sp.]